MIRLPPRLIRSVYRQVERGWALAAAVLLRPVPPSFRAWLPGGRVAIVAPHPDDETLAAGGTAALHVRAGDDVTIVVVSDGRASLAGGLAPDEMAARRLEEVRAAAATLGVTRLVCLGLPEGRWTMAEAQPQLQTSLAGAEIVYGPSCVDFHPEHLQTAHLLAGVLSPRQTVRVVELGVPLTPLLANLAADIGPVVAHKRQALACFAGQALALAPLGRLAHYRAALFGIEQVEVFWELAAPAYRRVMAYGTWGWRNSPFYGIRPRPFSDGLTLLAGWRTRRHLRAVAADGEMEPAHAR